MAGGREQAVIGLYPTTDNLVQILLNLPPSLACPSLQKLHLPIHQTSEVSETSDVQVRSKPGHLLAATRSNSQNGRMAGESMNNEVV